METAVIVGLSIFGVLLVYVLVLKFLVDFGLFVHRWEGFFNVWVAPLVWIMMLLDATVFKKRNKERADAEKAKRKKWLDELEGSK